MTLTVLDVDAIRSADVKHEPYDFFAAHDVLRADAIDDLRRDFPDLSKPGYLTLDDDQLKGRFRTLIEELEGEELTEELSRKFGRDLHPCPRLTTVMKQSQPKYGAIHSDGEAKVMTLLVYMNDHWDGDDGSGRLRVLYDEHHFEPYALEVSPTMGSMFTFLRSDKSWHGHKPFSGERRVVQVAWLKDEAALDRKKKRNSFAQVFKGILGR